MNKPFLIPAINLGELNFRLEKLNKKAEKLGLPKITAKVTGVTVEKGKRWFSVEIDGVAPKLPDWEFLGTLQHTDGGNILRSVPNKEIPESYRTAARTCDHCRKIRNRKDTYIVRHASGEVKQVGHNCVRDFLGHIDPKSLARMMEIVRLMEESQGEGFGSSGRWLDMTVDYVAMCVEVIKRDGWVSRSASQKYAAKADGCGLPVTSDVAWGYMHPSVEMIQRGDTLAPTEESYSLAKEALEFVANISPKSQYDANLQVAAKQEMLEYRNRGLVASLVVFFQKDLAKRTERANKFNELKNSKHVGEIKARREFTVVVDGEHTFDAAYGSVTLYRMRDMEGNVLTWWTGAGSLDVGKTYVLVGTVKKHDVYKEINQTVLTRCKVDHEVTSEVSVA